MEDLSSRAKNIRRTIIEMAYRSKDTHIGCCLSAVDPLTALYFGVLRIDPAHPEDDRRDRFILSKGHAAAALYATLAERGFFPKEDLASYSLDGSRIANHVTYRIFPGVETTGGSGGHGLSLGAGMAFAARHRKNGARIYVLAGDGELQEGSVWEAAMFAGSRGLDNLTLVVDQNKFQTLALTRDIVNVEPLAHKFRAFHWEADVVDGHDLQMLVKALSCATDKPHVVIADTIKGRGVSFIEGKVEWHNKTLSEAEYRAALAEMA